MGEGDRLHALATIDWAVRTVTARCGRAYPLDVDPRLVVTPGDATCDGCRGEPVPGVAS